MDLCMEENNSNLRDRTSWYKTKFTYNLATKMTADSIILETEVKAYNC